MTDAEKVVKALREQARKHDEAAAHLDKETALMLLRGAAQQSALADFVVVAQCMRNEHGRPPMARCDMYDDALARLREVLDA